jgi:CTP:molybdopterin cytidylyltransferase MocA
MRQQTIAALVLAAGRSQRMGAFKPLLKAAGRTLLERAVTGFREAGVSDVRVVAGHERESLARALGPLAVRIIVNRRYDAGMFSSVLAGLSDLEAEITGVFILPTDIPLVRSDTIVRLEEQIRHQPDKILIPSYQERKGHPVFIPARFFPAIKQWRGPHGLRGALRAWAKETELVTVDDPHVLFDVDTPADLKELEKKCAALVEGERIKPGGIGS